jgi:CNT family concentrative nucleoside transporter
MLAAAPIVEALSRHTVDVPLSGRLVSAFGLVVLMGLAWLIGQRKRVIPWRVVIWGLVLQVAFAVFVLRTPWGLRFFESVNDGANKLLGYAYQGLGFVFGSLATGSPPVLAFGPLAAIIFFGALMSVLYHLGVMQRIVWVFDVAMRRTMRTSGAESLSAAANIFVGQTEAPLLVRPYVGRMTNSELMAVMVGGFANSAGGIFVAYVALFGDTFPNLAGHLLTCSILSAPASLLIAKLMVPEDGKPVTSGMAATSEKSEASNVVDAAARGAWDGLILTGNVVAQLIAFIALVAIANALTGWVMGWFGYPDLTLQVMLGWLLTPLAWIIGVPWSDAQAVGQLIGTKSILNEFMAYADLSTMLKDGVLKDPRSAVLASYALCGFANISSIAIQISGIAILAPDRRSDLARLGFRAMIGGTLATLMCAAVAGVVM